MTKPIDNMQQHFHNKLIEKRVTRCLGLLEKDSAAALALAKLIDDDFNAGGGVVEECNRFLEDITPSEENENA
jgi:hypothetical protein